MKKIIVIMVLFLAQSYILGGKLDLITVTKFNQDLLVKRFVLEVKKESKYLTIKIQIPRQKGIFPWGSGILVGAKDGNKNLSVPLEFSETNTGLRETNLIIPIELAEYSVIRIGFGGFSGGDIYTIFLGSYLDKEEYKNTIWMGSKYNKVNKLLLKNGFTDISEEIEYKNKLKKDKKILHKTYKSKKGKYLQLYCESPKDKNEFRILSIFALDKKEDVWKKKVPELFYASFEVLDIVDFKDKLPKIVTFEMEIKARKNKP